MSIRLRKLAALCTVVGGALLLVTVLLHVAQAQDQPGFSPAYRRWTRTASAYIADNKAFAEKKYNPANVDLTGFLTIYANDTALPTYLNGKANTFPEGSVIVAESSLAVNIPNTKVMVEKAAPARFTLWMIKDSQASADQGGWRWELWTNRDGQDINAGLDAKTQVSACVNCHRQLFNGLAAKTDLVFDDFSDTAHTAAYQALLAASPVATAAPTQPATQPTAQTATLAASQTAGQSATQFATVNATQSKATAATPVATDTATATP